MGNGPSVDEEHRSSEQSAGGVPRGNLRREKPWAAALQLGGCHSNHNKVFDRLVLEERRFIANMQVILDTFYWPLVKQVKEHDTTTNVQAAMDCPISRADVDTIFSDVDALIIVSRRLLPALEKANMASSKSLLVVFLQLDISFQVYNVFVTSWKKRLDCLTRMEINSSVAMFVRACELQKRCGGLRLRDIMIMPMERIIQYKIILESASKNCPPHLVVMQRELEKNMVLPPTVADQSISQRGENDENLFDNTKVAKASNFSTSGFSAMSPPRQKVKEGQLLKVCCNGRKPTNFVLFSDTLTHGSLASSAASLSRDYQDGHSLSIESIPLRRCFVIDGFAAPLHTSFVVASEIGSFLVQAESIGEKNEWVATLQATMANAPAVRSSSTMSTVSNPSIESVGERHENKAAYVSDAAALLTAKAGYGSSAVTGDRERILAEKNGIQPFSSAEPPTGNSFGMIVTSSSFPLRSLLMSPPLRSSVPSKSQDSGLNHNKKGERKILGWKRGRVAIRLCTRKTTSACDNGVSSSSGGGCNGGVTTPRVPSDTEDCGSGANGGDTKSEEPFKLEECSFWIACGPNHKVLRWETLRLDAPSNNEGWNGNSGFCRVLADPACLKEFRELLRARHASENLNFRDAVHHYQALCCQAVRAVLAGTANTGLQGERNGATCFVEAAEVAARSIVDRFIKQGAPEQVNLGALGRETILSRQAESPKGVFPPIDLFAKAWIEVSNLLQRDTFMQFRNSEAFLRLKRGWAERLNGILPGNDFVLASGGPTRASETLPMLVLHLHSPALNNRKERSTPSPLTANISQWIPKPMFLSSVPENFRPWQEESESPKKTTGATFCNANNKTASKRSVFNFQPLSREQSENAHAENPRPVKQTATSWAPVKTKKPRKSKGVSSYKWARATATTTRADSSGGNCGASCDKLYMDQTHLRRKAQRPCVMPPLPLAPSLRAFTTNGSAESSATESPAQQVLSATIEDDRVVRKGRNGAEKVKQEEGMSVRIPVLKSTSGVNRADGSVSTLQPSQAESPFVAPPLPPPRLTYGGSHIPTISASPTAPFIQRVVADSPSSRTMRRPVRSPTNGANKVYSAAYVKREREARGAKKGHEIRPQSSSRDELGMRRKERGTKTGGRKGRSVSATMMQKAAATGASKIARYNKVQLLFQAPPGNGLGVTLDNNNGMAIVSGFRASPDDSFDSVLGAGLRIGDILVSVNGFHVLGKFKEAVELTTRGQESGKLNLMVKRGQKKQ